MQMAATSGPLSQFISIVYLPNARASGARAGPPHTVSRRTEPAFMEENFVAPLLQFGNGLGDRATKRGEVIHFGLEACSKKRQGPGGLGVSVVLRGHLANDPRGPLGHP